MELALLPRHLPLAEVRQHLSAQLLLSLQLLVEQGGPMLPLLELLALLSDNSMSLRHSCLAIDQQLPPRSTGRVRVTGWVTALGYDTG